MKFQEIFFGTDGKVRSGWRAAIFVLGFAIAGMILGTGIFVLLAQTGLFAVYGAPAQFIANSAISLNAALLVGWLCCRLLEGLPFSSLGASLTNRWLLNLLLGLLIGALAISLAVGIAAVFGNFDLIANTAPTSAVLKNAALTLAIFGVAAAFEEALFRGYFLQTFARAGYAWPAILITSIAFGAVHLGNPNAGYLSSINTALAGIWFGVAYLKTRDLWFVWGIHWMWNWMQGSIFGIEVSGLTDIVSAPVMRELDHGPDWLTGASYGIEAGVACTIALVVSIAATQLLPLGKHNDLA